MKAWDSNFVVVVFKCAIFVIRKNKNTSRRKNPEAYNPQNFFFMLAQYYYAFPKLYRVVRILRLAGVSSKRGRRQEK